MEDPPPWLVDALRHINGCRRRACMECINYNIRIAETRDERLGPLV